MSRYLLRLAVRRALAPALFSTALCLAPALLPAQEIAAGDPALAPPPSPAAVLGHAAGEDGWLASWEEIVAYFDTLDATSPLVTVERIGQSVDGRPMLMAVITSASNHLELDSVRARQARLADPRGVPHAAVEEIIARQPAVAFIGASLHGNEIMATQMSMELAHDLVTDPRLLAALDEVVVLLVPGMNPDGLDITRSWWLETRGTPHAGSPMPWLYHRYTGHDNNRDFFMVTQPETRAVTEVLYRRWFPEVVYDVHQMGNRGSRFFVPPFADPLNPNLDPLLVRATNLVGVQMALDLTEAGKTGVSHAERYDLWWHGGARTVPARHNMVGILTEAASADFGDPIDQEAAELEQPAIGSMYPEPWEGGRWRPRDIVEYELIAAKSLVRLLARQRESFVRNFATLGLRQTELGTTGDPFAFVIPAEQQDPGSAAELVRVLRRGGVEVHRAVRPVEIAGHRHDEGTYVVLMGQPYRAHAKDLLEPQAYPEVRLYPQGPPVPPYDLAGWSLPLQMGVDVAPVIEPFALDGLAVIDSVPPPPGSSGGRGSVVALDPRLNATHRALHEVLSLGPGRGRVILSTDPVDVGGEVWPAGTPVLAGVADIAERMGRWVTDWGVRGQAVAAEPVGRELTRLRVALYRPWVASADEGWTRWVFEQWGVPYDSLRDAGIRAGALAERYDVIVIPDMTYRDMLRGLDPARSPAAYAGGMGDEGALALRAVVMAGGTLVLLDSSSEFAIRDLGVAVREVTGTLQGPESERWFVPGSLLRVEWEPSHPLAAGMPEESAVFYSRGPVFEVQPGSAGVTVVGRYPEEDLLLSGYSQGEEQVAGKAALVEARLGRGRVVMFGFRPQHRAQTHETFKLLFNALYLR